MSVLPPYTVTIIAIEKIGKAEGVLWGLSPGEVIAAASAIIAFFSAVIAYIALRSSIRESRRMQKHNHLSVQPLLNIGINSRYNNGTNTIDFQLESIGVGPAIVKRFVIFLDDKKFVMPAEEEDLRALMQVAFARFNLHIKDSGYAPAIAVDKNLVALAMEVNGTEEEANEITDRFGFEIEYQSVYQNQTFYWSLINARGYPQEQNQPNKNLKETTA